MISWETIINLFALIDLTLEVKFVDDHLVLNTFSKFNLFIPIWISLPPENVKKLQFFRRFQGGIKRNNGVKCGNLLFQLSTRNI